MAPVFAVYRRITWQVVRIVYTHVRAVQVPVDDWIGEHVAALGTPAPSTAGEPSACVYASCYTPGGQS